MSSPYTGNPANNPTSITIPSDGDGPGIHAADVDPAFEGLMDKIAHTQVNLALGVATFTSSGTWTVPAGCTMALVYGYGGGGGGGGGAAGSGSNSSLVSSGGGGGGSAMPAWLPLTGLTPGESLNVTIGAGGAGGAGGTSGARTGVAGSVGGNTKIARGATDLIVFTGAGGGGGGAAWTVSAPTVVPVTPGGGPIGTSNNGFQISSGAGAWTDQHSNTPDATAEATFDRPMQANTGGVGVVAHPSAGSVAAAGRGGACAGANGTYAGGAGGALGANGANYGGGGGGGGAAGAGGNGGAGGAGAAGGTTSNGTAGSGVSANTGAGGGGGGASACDNGVGTGSGGNGGAGGSGKIVIVYQIGVH